MKFNLPDFRRACVLVVGDVMLDRYWYGQHSIISSDVPVIKVDSIDERPGGAANVAMNIAALGASARLIGLIGIDDAASTLNMRLRDVDVICDFVTLANYPTTVKLRVISRNKQLIRLDLESRVGDFDASPLLERIKRALPAASILVISDYAKGTLKHVREMIIQAKDAGVKVLVDPKGTDFSRYCGATLLTPNLSEFEGVSGGPCKDEMTIIRRGMTIIDDYNLSALLITRSEQGMTLLQQGKDPLYLPPNAKKVSDVTGAGDTVIGVLAVSLAAGNSIEDACFLANIAAGIVVGKLCTATISVAELENEILGSAERKFGVMTENELKQAVALARNRGEKLVMTNGIFDILHSGHVNYLAQARKLGDRLIVAVNSDDSTKRIKDKSRPVNSLSQRMNVLSALKAVDWVVSFSEDTPQRLIADILPDVLVKGGDYQPNQIAGSKEVWAHGGDVQVLNFEDSCSTTNIIKVIKDNARS